VNILLMDGLPEAYEGIPLSADFRNMIQVDLILHDIELSEVEKTMLSLDQLYPDIPSDVGAAIKGLEWFFSRGKAQEGKGQGKAEKKAFDFDQDAELIFAAFYSAYHISLTTVDFLHWWEFMALLEGLPEDTLIKRVMYWRTAELTGMSKEEKKHVLKMRKMFALTRTGLPMSVEDLEQKTKDEIERRYAEAKRWAQEQKMP